MDLFFRGFLGVFAEQSTLTQHLHGAHVVGTPCSKAGLCGSSKTCDALSSFFTFFFLSSQALDFTFEI